MTGPYLPLELVSVSLRLLPVLFSVLVKTSILLALAFVLQRLMKTRLCPAAACAVADLHWRQPPDPAAVPGRAPVPAGSRHLPAAGPIAGLSSTVVLASGGFSTGGVSAYVDMPPVAAEAWRQATIGATWPGLWPPLVLALVAAGALWGWLRMLGGRVRLARGVRRAQRGAAGRAQRGAVRRAQRVERLTRELSRRVGIRREVSVVECESATTSLTRGILHPLIVLPPAMRTWPEARVRSVLLHELCHVKRGDSLSLSIAYGICSLLWFVPPIWAACSRLCLEQEKACDAAVIESGVRRHSYAACILDAAQLCREPVLLAGPSFSGRRKKVLRDRVFAIVKGGRKMKKGVALFGFSVLLLVSTIALSAAGMESKGKILMVIRNGDPDAADFMLSQEAAVMKLRLESSGYAVVVATVDGQPARGSSFSLKADLKMADVQVADYKGFIIPCMAAGDSPIPPESVQIVKKAMAMKKPIAAQNSAVFILSQAGATKGRRFAIEADLASWVKDGTYSGIGVVQDANLVTSGTCPYMAAQLGKPDGTPELVQRFVALIGS